VRGRVAGMTCVAACVALVAGCQDRPSATVGSPMCVTTPVVGQPSFTYLEFTNWPHAPRGVQWLVDGDFAKLGGSTTSTTERVSVGPGHTSTWQVTLQFVPTHVGETIDVQVHDHIGNMTYYQSQQVGQQGCEVQPAPRG
jgi:hypothetical protein